ncbi:hypothetical protein SAMN05421875_11868 [Acidovorax soli]|uniref:Uncharacterized protein n=1 Tax=Acidovorax soli TaxID=592050 RepID=A0A1H4CCX5_9BURK|nr:hypothetical protein SAMN05421875_11868 [Acidovorax soli]
MKKFIPNFLMCQIQTVQAIDLHTLMLHQFSSPNEIFQSERNFLIAFIVEDYSNDFKT